LRNLESKARDRLLFVRWQPPVKLRAPALPSRHNDDIHEPLRRGVHSPAIHSRSARAGCAHCAPHSVRRFGVHCTGLRSHIPSGPIDGSRPSVLPLAAHTSAPFAGTPQRIRRSQLCGGALLLSAHRSQTPRCAQSPSRSIPTAQM
jgi:hypothetical protein